MSEYIIKVEHNDEMFDYANAQYTHFFGYPITEEIVRCRDCKYHVENDTLFSFYNGTCDWWAESPKVDPDGFCKWGVRA